MYWVSESQKITVDKESINVFESEVQYLRNKPRPRSHSSGVRWAQVMTGDADQLISIWEMVVSFALIYISCLKFRSWWRDCAYQCRKKWVYIIFFKSLKEQLQQWFFQWLLMQWHDHVQVLLFILLKVESLLKNSDYISPFAPLPFVAPCLFNWRKFIRSKIVDFISSSSSTFRASTWTHRLPFSDSILFTWLYSVHFLSLLFSFWLCSYML
jgi:hypothetical protein